MSSLHKGWKGERLKVKRIVEKGGKKIGRKKVDKENSTKKKEEGKEMSIKKKKKKLTKSKLHIFTSYGIFIKNNKLYIE